MLRVSVKKTSRRTTQEVAAGISLAVAAYVAWSGSWVFAGTLPVTKADPTFAQQIFSDRATIGFVRFGLVLLALYVIASIPALVVGGRWIKGFNTTGLTADDALIDSPEVITSWKKQVQELIEERDKLLALTDEPLPTEA